MRWLTLSLLGACAVVPAEDRAPVQALRFGADTHVHLTMSSAAAPLFDGEPGSGVLTWNPSARLKNHVEEAHLRAAGVKLVFGALWPPNATRPHRTALDESLSQVDALEDFALRNPGFHVVRSAAQAREAVAKGFIAVVPQLEGGEGITRPADVDALYGAGIRCLTVVHFVDSPLGGAAHGQLSRNFLGGTSAENNPRGLSELGRAAVSRAMDVGMLLDLSHASEALADDVLTLAEARGVPVINSHTGARAQMDMERNLSSTLAARIAKGGGLIGVTLFASQLQVPDSVGPDHLHGGCDDVVSHWRSLASAATPSAIVLGSDLNSFITRARPGGACPRGLRNTADLPALFSALEAGGLPREALDGMGEQVLRVLEAVEAKAAPLARLEAEATRKPFLARDRSHFSVNW